MSTKPCPNCEATMEDGDCCPECDHSEIYSDCDCAYCAYCEDAFDRRERELQYAVKRAEAAEADLAAIVQGLRNVWVNEYKPIAQPPYRPFLESQKGRFCERVGINLVIFDKHFGDLT